MQSTENSFCRSLSGSLTRGMSIGTGLKGHLGTEVLSPGCPSVPLSLRHTTPTKMNSPRPSLVRQVSPDALLWAAPGQGWSSRGW